MLKQTGVSIETTGGQIYNEQPLKLTPKYSQEELDLPSLYTLACFYLDALLKIHNVANGSSCAITHRNFYYSMHRMYHVDKL